MAEDKYAEVVRLLDQLGSQNAVAKHLGVARSTVRSRLGAAARRGYVPTGTGSPGSNAPGFHTSRTTVQMDGDGNVIQEWRRSSPTEEALRELVETLKDETPRAKPIKLPALKKSDLLGMIVLTDLHVGKLGYAPEVGDNYDTSIAEQLGVSAVAELMPTTDGCGEVALLVNGDHWHADNRSGTTEKSGNILDMDGRYRRNLRAGIRVLVAAVDMLLARGTKVRLVIVPGNHDFHSAICASEIMEAYYRSQKRVEVDTTSAVRKAIVFGKCLIAAAHGDGIRPDKWASLIPVDPVTGPHWSGCPHRYLFLGHIHSRKSFSPVEIQEATGLHVEYLPSLCGPDAWHYEHGYIGAGRRIDALVFHREHGMQGRATRDVAQIAQRAGLEY